MQIENDDGSILSVIMNALCLALMDAGVPMKGMFGAVSCVRNTEDQERHWDPTAEEEQKGDCQFVFVYNSEKEMIYSDCSGEFDVDLYMLVLQKGRQVAVDLWAFFREAFEKLLVKDVKYQMLLKSKP